MYDDSAIASFQYTMRRCIRFAFGKAAGIKCMSTRFLRNMWLDYKYDRDFERITAVGEKNIGEKSRIFIDMTEVHFHDFGTGIQRVVKELTSWLEKLATDYDVVRVFCDGAGYRLCATGTAVNFCRGDILFVVDQSVEKVYRHRSFFQRLQERGVMVSAFFHDLLPIQYPDFFWRGAKEPFERYLHTLLLFPLIICNSASVAQELESYLLENPQIERNPRLRIKHSLLGCDFSRFEIGQNADAGKSVGKKESIDFIMVSTVEPRKMYAQAIQAFDILWSKGLDVRLNIVGRPGWRNERTFQLIERNSEYGRRLLWYKSGISDDELAGLYERSDAVIFASVAEGFGLAVAEGAYFKKPLILRDIPVFREIAGDGAFYFTGEDAQSLADAIKRWIPFFRSGKAPDSRTITLSSWKECAERVLGQLTEKQELDKL